MRLPDDAAGSRIAWILSTFAVGKHLFNILSAIEHTYDFWRLVWGTDHANSVRGVNLMRVRDGRIVEAQGYVKGT